MRIQSKGLEDSGVLQAGWRRSRTRVGAPQRARGPRSCCLFSCSFQGWRSLRWGAEPRASVVETGLRDQEWQVLAGVACRAWGHWVCMRVAEQPLPTSSGTESVLTPSRRSGPPQGSGSCDPTECRRASCPLLAPPTAPFVIPLCGRAGAGRSNSGRASGTVTPSAPGCACGDDGVRADGRLRSLHAPAPRFLINPERRRALAGAMTETLFPLCFPSVVEWLLGHCLSGGDAPGTVPSRKRQRTRLQQTRKAPTPTAASAPHLAAPMGAQKGSGSTAQGPALRRWPPPPRWPEHGHGRPAAPASHAGDGTGGQGTAPNRERQDSRQRRAVAERDAQSKHTKSGAPRALTAGVTHAGQHLPPKISSRTGRNGAGTVTAGLHVSTASRETPRSRRLASPG